MFELMAIIFLLGYAGIVFEHKIKINRAGIALVMGALMWAIYALNGTSILSLGYSQNWLEFISRHPEQATPEMTMNFITEHELFFYLSRIASIFLFLIAAMGIVEVVDRFHGFRVITDQITTRNRFKLMWILTLLTFFMSAVLDNVTTTAVMITLTRKFMRKPENRWIFAGLIVIAANMGGAWSPIGDITTVMLWIGEKITTINIFKSVFLPSLVGILIPLGVASIFLKGGETEHSLLDDDTEEFNSAGERKFIFFLGVGILLLVPVFKRLTHLPPYMGMLIGLGIIWLITDLMLRNRPHEDRRTLSVSQLIHNLDAPTLLYFAGIFTAVTSLTSAGQLNIIFNFLETHVGSIFGINMIIGAVSSVVDNIILVAGAIGVHNVVPIGAEGHMANFVQNGQFWTLLAYSAGAGGSLLLIGSAAGMTAMNMENIRFGWYVRKISWLALLGYLGGAATYYFQQFIF
jgi:Na+/H+ antiporter NhaD/arsenite permease-like protein